MMSRPPLASALERMREDCTDCGACLTNCAFLSQHGTPGTIAARFDFTSPQGRQIAYQCSLCGLCAAVCPEKLDPGALFLDIRRRHVEDGDFESKPYRSILRYESLGGSALFTQYVVPPGCDTVLFPGCTLPGTRPAVTLELYRQLRRIVPSLGIVLACCGKPSHDLGRTAHFQAAFGTIRDRLVEHGVRTVLTACPNCTTIFSQYGQGLTVQTVYQPLHLHGLAKGVAAGASRAVSIHDPCPGRDDVRTQAAVRGIVTGLGHTLVELRHSRRLTMCCGEGGTVGCAAPELSDQWADRRRREADARVLVTCCAGCAGRLNRVTPTVHVLDLLFRPLVAFHRNLPVARAPFTYVNRLLLKRRIKGERLNNA
ncbi:(Fe-S)-binding protein [Desulfoprunum benzoelyticum]|uniref:Fe-S oxidoreductase n=1 Tax=Desulfoprunum benzoelyticum TaxID=1506996 RepID=A0A840UQU3_9BACT|nr:(Fe-S)-binding protein [Desulfoprunum benzoelyticum]MBB5348015.1 Fe-S oxidoreductase [Desulfoprunum benzoelyticum]MBM9530427.1 (Fe-S)-binding protein [Desulfoprunum benzoelyticum]